MDGRVVNTATAERHSMVDFLLALSSIVGRKLEPEDANEGRSTSPRRHGKGSAILDLQGKGQLPTGLEPALHSRSGECGLVTCLRQALCPELDGRPIN
jgi:hypothetical protein